LERIEEDKNHAETLRISDWEFFFWSFLPSDRGEKVTFLSALGVAKQTMQA